MFEQIGLILLTSSLIVAGLVGVVVPFLPGVPLAWLGLFIYALATGFETITWTWLIIFGVLTAFTFVLDFIGPAMGASGKKGSKWAVIGSLVGTVGGVAIFGVLGIVIGPLIGAFIGEYIVERNYKDALIKSYGAFMGYVAAMMIKIVIVITMGIYFLIALI